MSKEKLQELLRACNPSLYYTYGSAVIRAYNQANGTQIRSVQEALAL